MLSLSEAAKTAGVSRSTIWRACKAGRVSFKRNDTGEFQIDAAELHRVFPFHATGGNSKMNHHAIGVAETEMAILDARIAALKDMAELMRERLEDIRKDRDAWRGQAEANQRLVVDARTRRGLFGWGAKRWAGSAPLISYALLTYWHQALDFGQRVATENANAILVG